MLTEATSPDLEATFAVPCLRVEIDSKEGEAAVVVAVVVVVDNVVVVVVVLSS